MTLRSTIGADSGRGFGLYSTSTTATYIEDVFSTYLYTGNGSTQTITNGIDLSGKGGMVWIKARNLVSNHGIFDTVRGRAFGISSNLNSAQTNSTLTSQDFSSFNSNGFTVGAPYYYSLNDSTYNFVSWTFRKQPKFFDIVTYTGTGANRTIAHNLGSVPGMIIIKRTDTTGDWQVYHRSLANTEYMVLNTNATKATGTTRWNSTTPTATEFSLGTDATVNANSGTYVAYLFANNAGGFGNAGTDSVVSCGSFVGNTGAGNGPDVNLGWEPQWILFKDVSTTDNWRMFDNIRGLSMSEDAQLVANLQNAEVGGMVDFVNPTSTGFRFNGGTASTYIYIAIRRGPMRTPTSGTSVFSPNATNGTTTITTNFPVDALFSAYRSGGYVGNIPVWDRLRGGSAALITSSTDVETISATYGATFDSNTTTLEKWWASTLATANWSFRRAPGFFDVVCFTGTGSTVARNHNLGVAPELFILKARSSAGSWLSWSTGLISKNYSVKLNLTNAQATEGVQWIDVSSTTFTLAGAYAANGTTYVAYLFASCPGVSKVGSYTGTGATQTISCGFTGGARYVLIKRTDSTGDWWVWDTARGMVAGTDPRLAYNNSTAAETNADWVYTTTGGFQIVTSDATVNASGGTYIYLAIA